MFEKACSHCGNKVSFEKNVKAWKCSACGKDNTDPLISLLTVVVVILVFYYLVIPALTVFWNGVYGV